MFKMDFAQDYRVDLPFLLAPNYIRNHCAEFEIDMTIITYLS